MILAALVNKDLRREEQNKFSKKLPQMGIEPETLRLFLWHVLSYMFMPSSLGKPLLPTLPESSI